MASAHQRPALPGTKKRHNTTAGTARMRKYVKTLGRLTALTAAGAGATVFMERTRALEGGERQWGGSGTDDHELGKPPPDHRSGLAAFARADPALGKACSARASIRCPHSRRS